MGGVLRLMADYDGYISEAEPDTQLVDGKILKCKPHSSTLTQECIVLSHWNLDLGGILAGAVIKSAKWIITMLPLSGLKNSLMHSYVVGSAFSSATTWTTKPAISGTQYPPAVLPVPLPVGVPVEIDVKHFINIFIANPSIYFGLAIKADPSDTNDTGFTAKGSKPDSIVGGGLPMLVIEYNQTIAKPIITPPSFRYKNGKRE